jgi:hypothetical protein
MLWSEYNHKFPIIDAVALTIIGLVNYGHLLSVSTSSSLLRSTNFSMAIKSVIYSLHKREFLSFLELDPL